MQESSKKSGRKGRGTKGKSPKQDLTNATDLTLELPDGCEYPSIDSNN